MIVENKDRVRAFILSCFRKKGSVLHFLRQDTHIFRRLLCWLGYRPFLGFRSMRLGTGSNLRQACFQSTKLYTHDESSVFVFETMHPGWPVRTRLKVGEKKQLKTIAAHPRLPLVGVCDLFETLYVLDSLETPNGHRLRLRGQMRLDRNEYDGSIGCLDFHPLRPLLALGTKQRLVLVSTSNKDPKVETNVMVAGFVHKVQFHNTRDQILIADHQGCIALYDLEGGALRYLPYTGNPLSILVSASADLSRVVASSGVSVQMLEKRGEEDGRYERVLLHGYDQLQKGVALHRTLPIVVQNTSSLHKTAIAVTRTDPCWQNPWRSSLPARDPSTVFGTLILHPTVPLVLTVRPFEMVAFSLLQDLHK